MENYLAPDPKVENPASENEEWWWCVLNGGKAQAEGRDLSPFARFPIGSLQVKSCHFFLPSFSDLQHKEIGLFYSKAPWLTSP